MRKVGILWMAFIALMLVAVAPGEVFAEESAEKSAEKVSARDAALIDHCAAIKESLKLTQKNDSHARVYLGGRFETLNSKFVIPLNTRLVENSLSESKLVDNQNDLTKTKAGFVTDFIDYQKELEGLVNMDCRADPEGFYKSLEKAREKRKTVAKDVKKMRELLGEHQEAIKALEDKV